MKRLIDLALLMTTANFVYAQADVRVWTRQLGLAGTETGYDVTTDNMGNVILVGVTQGPLAGPLAGRYDIIVAKYDSRGNRLWIIERGTIERDFAYSVATDAAGNIYLTGYVGTDAAFDGNTSHGDWDMYLMKISPDGTWLWTVQDGTAARDEGRAVAVDPWGNVYATGYVRGSFHGNPKIGAADVYVSKYDSNGNRLWTRTWGSLDVDESFGIACDAGGNVFVVGWCSASVAGDTYKGNGDNVLAKYDTNGNRLWLRQWGTANKDTCYAVTCDAAGNAYVSGYTTGPLYGPQLGGHDYFLVKYDPSGNQVWGRQDGTGEHDDALAVRTDAAANVYVAGSAGGPLDGCAFLGGLSDAFLSKYDSNGNRLWTTTTGTATDDSFHGVALLGNSVFVSGETLGGIDGYLNNGMSDMFLMKYAPASEVALAPTGALANPAVLCSGSGSTTGSSSQLSATPGMGGDTVEWFTGSCGGTAVPGGASPTVSPSATTQYFAWTRDTTRGLVSDECAIVTVTVATPIAPDFDQDCDVDLLDLEVFAGCASIPMERVRTGCENTDFDGDNDVDQSDFGILQRCYSDESTLADPSCAD